MNTKKAAKKVWRKPLVKTIAAGAAETGSGTFNDSAGSTGHHS